MTNTYIFEDFPVKFCLENYTSEKEILKNSFEKKYPELIERFSLKNGELLFTISEAGEINEHNWTVDFLESNVNGVRPYNEMGIKLDENIYKDLFEIFSDENGDVFFASSSDTCVVETTGKFDSRCKFTLKIDGLHWEIEEDDDEWEDEEEWEED